MKTPPFALIFTIATGLCLAAGAHAAPRTSGDPSAGGKLRLSEVQPADVQVHTGMAKEVVRPAGTAINATVTIATNIDDTHWQQVGPHTSAACAAPCADYSTAMVPHLEITLPSLPPNRTDYYLDLTATPVVSVVANDGLHTYSAANVERVVVTTDSLGIPTQFIVVLQVWLTGTSPHQVNDLEAEFIVANHGGFPGMQARTRQRCLNIGYSAGGVPDFCVADSANEGIDSYGFLSAVPNFRVVTTAAAANPQSAPTLSPWALLALLLMLFGGAFRSLRRPLSQASQGRMT